MATQRKSIHGEWSSNWAFILATTGAAVGLGNIWKFPYIAGENGGGAFVLVYLVCVLILGIPIMMAEVIVGRRGRQNPANTMRSVALESNASQHWQWAGGLIILAGFLILTYYSVIAGWAMDYVFQAAFGHFNHQSSSQISQLFNDLVSSPYRLIFWHSMIMIGTVTVVALGVEKGLERSIRFMFPTMLILLLIVIGYSIKTGFFGQGLSFLFKPDLHAVTGKSVLVALGHAFFTLSIATGSIMMYGAYVPQTTSIPKAIIAIAIGDTLIALLAGLAIFPIVFAHGLEPGAGPGLIFKTLPLAFGNMQYGQFVGTLFFIMLVFAAFTSAISLIEPTVAWLIENFRLSRLRASMLAGFAIWLIGFGTIFSFNVWSDYTVHGKNFFDMLDYFTANIMLPLGGMLVAVFAAWKLAKQTVVEELRTNNGLLYTSWHFVIGYITPIAVLVVFFNSI